ncbi:uncharacterized protein LOC144586462 [Pogona vitticeps]
MSLARTSSKTQLIRTQGCNWRKPSLEQPKRLVYKKIIKPLMEKKRRNRIAHSLNQLKALLLDGSNPGNKAISNSRMDKAALLEMTVKRIQTLQLAAAFISDRQQYQETPNQLASASSSICETTTLAIPLPAPNLGSISIWSGKHLTSATLHCSGRSVPSVVLSKTGSQVFWRPWST